MMRVGVVCPYSFDVPGGVQSHVRGVSEALQLSGSQVSVLAPSTGAGAVPAYVSPAGRAVPVPYNGSVARLTFGPLSLARVRRWLRDGDFDVLHVHEPATPSLSLLALWASEVPTVATFHTTTTRSRAMAVSAGILRPALQKLGARIAVSEPARATLTSHVGGASMVIPNGVWVRRFRDATPDPRLSGRRASVVFLGRFDEPRKGLAVLLAALPAIRRSHPEVRVLVVGSGDVGSAQRLLPAAQRDHVTWLGTVDDVTRGRLLAGADVFVAPNTGSESFGMVVLEAMAAGAPVVASDIPAFAQLLEHGRYGELFTVGQPADLARAVQATLTARDLARGRAQDAGAMVWRYDWSRITGQLLGVYRSVAAGVRCHAE